MERKSQAKEKAPPRLLLRYERERRGWTLPYVATRISCPDPHMIRRWESGKVSPSPHYRQALCELFGKSAEELGLLLRTPGGKPPQPLADPIPPSDDGGLIFQHHQTIVFSLGQVTSEDRSLLPDQLTSFVGRQQELTAVCELLRRAEVRLLTLTGTGGIGKTRLGLRVLPQMTNGFPDGVRFLSLMETSDPELVVPTIAHKLRLQEIGSQPIFPLLKTFLKKKQMLLFLDNFEHVVQAAPVLVDLLGSCPYLKILVTSRTVLRVSGEYVYPLPPLELPDLTQLPETMQLAQYPAVMLFLERARAALPDFAMSDTNAPVIAEICTHLDGLPLAIELVIPALKVLSPQLLLARLDHRLEVLTAGVRDAPERQQTLRNTLAWSYRLLNPLEQKLFCYLCIFVDGCTLPALESVWERLEGLQKKGQVFEGVVSLLDKNMLQQSVREGEESRLLMLRTLREYGLERLLLDRRLELAQWAHARYYLALAEEAEPMLRSSHAPTWLERLEREHDNLREALCYLIAQGQWNSIGTELALRLGTALEQFWIIRGYVKEGRDLLGQALKDRLNVSHALRGYAMKTVANLAGIQGDLSSGEAAYGESLTCFREMGNAAGITRALCGLGTMAQRRGEYATARTFYEESLTMARGEQEKEALSEVLYCFASMIFFQGDFSAAHVMLEECLTYVNILGDQRGRVGVLNLLGWLSLLEGNTQLARALEEESLTICKALCYQHGIAHMLSALGYVACQADDVSQASEYFEEGLALMMQLGDQWMAAFCLEGLAKVATVQGNATRAVYLLSTATALRDATGIAFSPLEHATREHMLSTLHNLLGEQDFALAWTQGQITSPEQAIE